MKTLPAGMQDDLDGGATFYVHAYKLTRRDGTVMGFTSHDRDLTFDSVTYEADSGYTPSQFEQSTGMNVDGIEAFGFLQSDRITDDDIFAGKYDNAEIIVYKVNWKDPSKRVIEFRGHVGNVSRGRLAFIAEVRSLSHILNQPSGRTHKYTCDARLFDARCGVVKTSTSPGGHAFQFVGVSVNGVTDRRVFSVLTSGLNVPEAWFTRGVVTWQTGSNATFKMEVKRDYRSGLNTIVELWEPMPFDIQVGDTFDIVAGCDKTIETCKAKFNNVLRFRGFPRMPNQDHILVFAGKSGDNDGSSLFN